MYFPILRNGAATQYPVTRMVRHGPILAETPGGAVWLGSSGAEPLRRWHIAFQNLTDAEVEALVQLHETCGGWRTFCFADPLANLLRWSEDLTNPVWGRSPGVTVTRSAQDAGGASEFLIVNTGAATGYVWQDLDLAPGAICCFSCALWSEGAAQAALQACEERKTVIGLDTWQPHYVTGVSTGGMQRVRIEVGAGGILHVRHVQAELQVAPSPYKPSFENGGVFSKTRFARGGIRIVTTAPDRHAADVMLEAMAENEA